MAQQFNLDEFAKEFAERLNSKKLATGYFFVINEVVYPFYYDDFVAECDMKEAWELLCTSWLNTLLKKKLQPLLPYLIRGEVKADGVIVVGNNVDFYLDEIKHLFKFERACIEPFLELDEKYRLNDTITPEAFTLLKYVYQHVPYLDSLPWTVRLHLRNRTSPVESNSILGGMVKYAQASRKGKRTRLGAAPGVAKC
jgi:hypothetical protein